MKRIIIISAIMAVAVACGGGGGAASDPPASQSGGDRVVFTPTVRLTDTPAPPTPTDTPPPPPTATPEPVVLSGVGQTATAPVTLPSPLSVATLTHEGSSNFAVWLYQDGERRDLLVNEIGRYQGRRPLMLGGGPIVFDVSADGPWTIHIEPLGPSFSFSFSSSGDDVSGAFIPPETGPWEFSHDGRSNFAVWLHCVGGSDLIQNEIGRVSGSGMVQFEEGPCFWEVEADGNWSLTPRQ